MSESNEVNFHVPYDNNVILLLVYFLFCIKDDYFILYTFSIFKMHCFFRIPRRVQGQLVALLTGDIICCVRHCY